MCGFAGRSRGARPHSGNAAAHAAATASTRASDGPSGTSLPRRPSNPKVWKHRRHAAGWCLQPPSAASLPRVRPAVRVREGALVCGCVRVRVRVSRARALARERARAPKSACACVPACLMAETRYAIKRRSNAFAAYFGALRHIAVYCGVLRRISAYCIVLRGIA